MIHNTVDGVQSLCRDISGNSNKTPGETNNAEKSLRLSAGASSIASRGLLSKSAVGVVFNTCMQEGIIYFWASIRLVVLRYA